MISFLGRVLGRKLSGPSEIIHGLESKHIRNKGTSCVKTDYEKASTGYRRNILIKSSWSMKAGNLQSFPM